MKKFYLILLLSFSFGKAKSQELLNKGEKEIKTYMESNGGVFVRKTFHKATNFHPADITLFYTFGTVKLPPKDILWVSYSLSSDDKCYMYMIRYDNDRLLGKLIAGFSAKDSELGQVDFGKKWEDDSKKYTIDIVRDKNRGNDMHSTGFLLIYSVQGGHVRFN